MLRKLIGLGAAVVLVIMISACATHTELPSDPQDVQVHGQQIYIEYCAECHQTDGMGWDNLYPRLAGNPIVNLQDPSPLIETVTYGQGSMMGFHNKLNSYDIAAALTYIRGAWGNNAPAVSPHQTH